ncbi:MAG TPA: DNA polymerase III subunit epsilon [Rickettsiales bacterium]|nr:DNA polymerase III subunit epsilon [Rickettsiales bacterium]
MREICFDTETTGLDPKNGDKITEIGCVEIIDRKVTGNSYRQIINPGRKNNEESIRITGLTDEILKDKPFFSEIFKDFLEFIGNDSILIAHNATFDTTFVNYELSLLGVEPIKNTVIDSLSLAKVKFPGKKNNLDALCERYGIDNSNRTKHGALLDAELLAEVYLKLTEEEQSSFFSSNNKSKESLDIKNLLDAIKTKDKLEKRNFIFDPSEEEKHKAFIEKNIKNSLWN